MRSVPLQQETEFTVAIAPTLSTALVPVRFKCIQFNYLSSSVPSLQFIPRHNRCRIVRQMAWQPSGAAGIGGYLECGSKRSGA
jgi:hypothetical protein